MSKAKVMKVLGIVSIILGGGAIVATLWPFSFAIGGTMLAVQSGEITRIIQGLAALSIFFFATWGFIIAGVGMLKQKKWGIILFAIGIIFWAVYLIFYFVDTGYSKEKWEDQEKQFMEERRKQFEWAEKEQRYWQEKWKEKQELEEKGD